MLPETFVRPLQAHLVRVRVPSTVRNVKPARLDGGGRVSRKMPGGAISACFVAISPFHFNQDSTIWTGGLLGRSAHALAHAIDCGVPAGSNTWQGIEPGDHWRDQTEQLFGLVFMPSAYPPGGIARIMFFPPTAFFIA